MGIALSSQQVENYRRDNFLSPVDALTSDEVQFYRQSFATYEREAGGAPLKPWQLRKLHVREAWAAELVRHPHVLDAVQDIIGPDILVFNATFFIKDAGSAQLTAWHQDATYFGLSPHLHVSAWIALSDASEAAGCMRFIPGSAEQGQLYHATQNLTESVNHGQHYIPQVLDDGASRCAPLQVGQFSLHHTLIVHSSAPNATGERRIGFGVSYIPAEVRHRGSQPIGATLVRGGAADSGFQLESDPRDFDAEVNAENHRTAYASYRRAYDEQIADHENNYAPGRA